MPTIFWGVIVFNGEYKASSMNLKPLLFLAGLVMLTCQSFAQAATQDCIGAIPICQPIYVQNVASPGSGNVQDITATNQDCLLGNEHLTTWYIINIVQSGTLVFTLTPASQTDYDFAVWNVTPNGCGQSVCDIVHNTPPVRCNYAGTGSGILTGLSTTATQPSLGAGGPGFSSAINAVVGESYMIVIDNFSQSNVGYTLDFSASTTSITDIVPPVFSDVRTRCGYAGDNLIVTMKEPVKCNTIAANGSDFTVTSAAGINYPVLEATSQNCIAGGSFSNILNLRMASALPAGTYTLHAQTGSDGNTLSDNCGNFQLTTDAINFTLAPPPSPIQIIKMDTPACKKARIVLNRPIKCSTVASNGSDFQVTGPSFVKVANAAPVGCKTVPYICGSTVDLTDTIDIEFDRSIPVAGTYSISVIWGSDGNPISDTCDASIAGAFNWVVSDHGYVDAQATPEILCYPGYVGLTSTNSIAGPPPPVSCGTNNTPCTNPAPPVTVGNSAATGTTTNTPLYGAASDSRTQMLFTAAQLRAAGLKSGTITQIGLNVTTKNSTAPYNNFTVKLKCTNTAALTNDFEPGAAIVYGPAPFTTALGQNTITLDNSYDWNDSMNLLVEICYHNNSSTLSDAVQTSTNIMPGAVLHNHQSGAIGCALTANTSSYPVAADRPNITFTECAPTSGPHTYLWTPSLLVGDTSAQNTVAYVPVSTTYKVQIMDSNFCYRRDTARVTVSVRHPSLLPNRDTAICAGDSVHLHAAGGVSYVWYPSAGLSCSNCTDPVARPTRTTIYHAVIFDQYGCSDTLKKTITVHPLPVVTASSDTTILYGQSVTMSALVTGGIYYLWGPTVGLNDPNIANPTATPQVTTIYTLLAIDTNQCRQQDSVKITVQTNVPVLIPSAFTPNGDSKNDVFHVANMSFQKLIEFRVFNRWGQEVFNTTDNNKGWDGTFRGKAQEVGVYNYIIRLAWPDGRQDTYKGDVTLMR